MIGLPFLSVGPEPTAISATIIVWTLSERLATVGIMVAQLGAPSGTPRASQRYGTEVF